jgi:MFS family permease
MRRDLQSSFAGLAILGVALGIGRFALTPLLPLMQADANLSLLAEGWLASMNNLGYLVGAMLCTALALPQRNTLRTALVLSGLLTLGMGLTGSTPAWLILRFLSGVVSAALVIHGIAFALARLRPDGPRVLEALVFTGTGVGIVFCGLLVGILHPFGMTSAEAWEGFGGTSLLTAAVIWRVLGFPANSHTGSIPKHLPQAPSGPVWSLLLAYGLIGFGYVIPAVFLPLIAQQHLHIPGLREVFWPIYGLATIAVTLVLPWLPARIGNRSALGLCCTSIILGELLCLFWPTLPGLTLGTVLIGGMTMPIVLLVMREARLLAHPDPTRLIAGLTAFFSIGQIVGPLLAAWLAGRNHSFAAPLALAAAALVLALGLTRIRNHAARCTA